MAEQTPLFMDISSVYSGDELGLPYRDLIGEGVVGATDLAVSQRGAGANLSVDVAAGSCWVLGDTNVLSQPCYRCRNDAVVNVGITPDPSNPRKVLVVAQVTDETFSGVGRQWRVAAVHGTPAASPAEPALPASACVLGLVDVPAADTAITNSQITDRRVRAAVGGGGIPHSLDIQRTAYDRVAAAPVDVQTSVVETSIYSKVIAAGDMGLDKLLRLLLIGDYLHNNVAADTVTLRIKFGGTTLWSAVMNLGNVIGAPRHPWELHLNLANLGLANSQLLSGVLGPIEIANVAAPAAGIGAAGVSGTALLASLGIATLGTVDTTVAQTLQVTAQWSASSANNSWRTRYAVLELV